MSTNHAKNNRGSRGPPPGTAAELKLVPGMGGRLSKFGKELPIPAALLEASYQVAQDRLTAEGCVFSSKPMEKRL